MAKQISSEEDPCPCGVSPGRSYRQCCGRFIHGGEIPATAAELMRSRYTAYALRDEAYLLRSWHASTRPAGPLTESGIRWLGLELRQQSADGDQATVEFVARCRINGRAQRLHEISRFARQDGKWLYVDGSFPEKPVSQKKS